MVEMFNFGGNDLQLFVEHSALAKALSCLHRHRIFPKILHIVGVCTKQIKVALYIAPAR